jgi:WD40 repeat protein
MEPLSNGRLVVSTKKGVAVLPQQQGVVGLERFLDGSTPMRVPKAQSVFVINLRNNNESIAITAILDGHTDAVQCMRLLPNGDLLTGGGKFDATLKMWERSQLQYLEDDETNHAAPRAEAELTTNVATTLPDVGYVFSLAVLPDEKPGSSHFAVAAARYNVVKILL